MSGGHWQYGEWQRRAHFGQLAKDIIEENTSCEGACNDCRTHNRQAADLLALLPDIEHALDWGLSGDTCPDCARLRASAAIESYLTNGSLEYARTVLGDGTPRCFGCWAWLTGGANTHWNAEHGSECGPCTASRLWDQYVQEGGR